MAQYRLVGDAKHADNKTRPNFWRLVRYMSIGQTVSACGKGKLMTKPVAATEHA